MITLVFGCLGITLLFIAATLWSVIRWGEGRRMAIFVAELATQQRIDALTRNTVEQMRRAAYGADSDASFR